MTDQFFQAFQQALDAKTETLVLVTVLISIISVVIIVLALAPIFRANLREKQRSNDVQYALTQAIHADKEATAISNREIAELRREMKDAVIQINLRFDQMPDHFKSAVLEAMQRRRFLGIF